VAAGVQAAEQANDPGRFTAFIGFEWTPNTGGNHLHRNGVFRDDASKASQVEPYTTMKPLGSGVDLANATWTNAIGAPELIAVWKDPGFDAGQRAFYYARVIEIPTPRWTAYDVKRFGNKPLPGTRMTITERGYTSPIWYTP
jgi:hypothetical protein